MTNEKVKKYLNNLPADRRVLFEKKNYDIWNFDNDNLLRLVLEGKKVATAGLLADHKKVPDVGDLGIITNSHGEPCCIIKYMSIETKPFLEVDFEFARSEGEGFKNIEEWRAEHRKLFTNWSNGGFTDESKILCESFKLLYPVK